MIKPSLLLFDLGGVIIENSTFRKLNTLIPEPVDYDILKRRWLRSSAVRKFELGKCSADQFAVEFIAEWNLELSPETFLNEFYTWPDRYYPGARQMLKSLRRRYRVGCLSNSNCLHWEKFNGFAEDFDIALSSHLLGAIKPDTDVFKKALEICETAAVDVCFFDDSEANIAAAREAGIHAYQTDGFNELLEMLTRNKLL